MTAACSQPRFNRPARRASAIAMAAGLACGLLTHAAPASALDLVWVGGSNAWTNSLSWVGNAIPSSSLDRVFIDNGNALNSMVTLNTSATIGQLFIDQGDWLSLTGGGTLGINGGILRNHGTFSLAASSSAGARLSLGANLTLSGSGITVLASDAGSGNRAAVSGAGSLTIANGHTVRGAGDLGSTTFGSIAVVNQGTVIVVGGTMRTYQTGTQTFDNTAGLVQIAAGAAFTATGRFFGGTVQSLATGTETGLIGGGTFSDVALRGTLQVETNQGLNLSGGTVHDSLLVRQATLTTSGNITTNGTLTLAATSTGWARMSLGGATSLSGSGITVLASDAGSGHRAAVSGAGPLTIASGHTVRGAGDLGSTTFGSIAVVNQGTVIAEGGAMRTYQTGAQTFDNTGGLVQVAAGAAFTATGWVTGGTVQSVATGTATGFIGGGTFSDVALRGPLQVEPTQGLTLNGGTVHDSLLVRQATLTTSGNITTNGTLTLAATSTGWARMSLGGATSLSGSGITVLASDAGSGHRAAVSGSQLTIASGHTVRGAGDLGSTTFGSTGIINRGTVIAEGGLMRSYQTGAQTFDNTGGLVQIASGASLVASGAISGGTIQGLGAQSLLSGNTFSNLALAGTLTVAAGTSVGVRGTLTNTGSLSLAATNAGNSQLVLTGDTTLAGTGTTVLASDFNSGTRAVITGSPLTIASGHTVRGAGDLGSTTFGSMAVVNQGTVIAEGGAMRAYQTGNQTFDNSAGTLRIGESGSAAVNGRLLLADASVLQFDVGTAANSSPRFGLLALGASPAFDGTLQLHFDGYTPAVGEQFRVIDFSGTFAGAFDAALANGYTLSLSYANTDVVATVTGVSPIPEPGTWALWMAGLLGMASLRRCGVRRG